MPNNNLIVTSNSKILLSEREKDNGHKAGVFWLTGLSGSGKSSLAYSLESILHKKGMKVYVLDGDNIRSGLNSDLDFSDQGRTENIRRIAEVALIMRNAGFIVITAFISPFKIDRTNAEAICGDDCFNEIFVNCPLEICEKRDAKGLYKRVRKGEILHFTGISSPYDIPENPKLTIDTNINSIDRCSETLTDFVISKTTLNEQ
jgi:adenylyl-sulfate kinase